MSADQPTVIYILTAIPEEQLTGVVERFQSAGYWPVIGQSAVLQAAEAVIPGVLANEAWIVLRDQAMDERSDILRAAGRLVGLESIDPSLIVLQVKVSASHVFFQSRDEIGVPYDQLASFVPAAITFIAEKMGARTARTAEKREVLENVDKSLEKHIAPVLLTLGKQERQLRWAAIAFYTAAMVALVGGLWLAALRAHEIHTNPPKSWIDVTGSSVSWLIVIGMLTAVARLAFILGRSFMVESLTNGDRAHAISFGRFYLQAFGHRAEWAEIKEAFQHWNIDRGSSFVAQTASDVDPIVAQVAVEAAKAFVSRTKN